MIKMKRIKAMLLAGALVVTSCMAGMTAMAEDVIPATPSGEYRDLNNLPAVEKTLKIADGTTLPTEGLKFTFTAVQETETPREWTAGSNYRYENDDDVQVTVDPGVTFFENSNFTNAEVDARNMKSVTKEAGKISIAPKNGVYNHAGIYLFRIYEDSGDIAGQIVHGGEHYYLTVFIKDLGSGTYGVDKVFLQDRYGDKTDKMSITNTYIPGELSLHIEKELEGDYANMNDTFQFTVKLLSVPEEADIPDDGYSVSHGSGSSGSVNVADNINVNDTISFSMSGGQSIDIIGLPSGARFAVTENDTTGKYTNFYTLIEGGSLQGSEHQAYTNTSVIDVTVSNQAEGAHDSTNSVVFINNRESSTPATGIIMNNLPFVLLIVVAVAGAVTYVVFRRKITR